MALSRKTKIGAALAATALVLGLVWAFAPRPLAVEAATAEPGPFETTIEEDARTRLRERYTVSAPLAGRLARITLREGDVVAAGAVLATLTPVLAPMLDERTRAEQRARTDAAESGLRRAATRIGAARVALEQARNGLRRTEQLAAQGFVAPTQIDAERLAEQAAQAELNTAIESEQIARHELQQARAALAVVHGAGASAGSGFLLRAPVAGRVLRVLQPSETTLALGTPLLELGDLSQLEVVAELLTSDALQAVPGSAVRIERWGGPGLLQGRVRRIEPAAFTKVSALGVEEQRVNVLIDITSPPAEWQALGDGYRVGVRIVTRSEPQVLRVPVSAVFPLPSNEARAEGAAVFVVEGGRARLRPVLLGGRNASSAWVQRGLQAGDTVIVYPAAAVVDGVRVQLRRV